MKIVHGERTTSYIVIRRPGSKANRLDADGVILRIGRPRPRQCCRIGGDVYCVEVRGCIATTSGTGSNEVGES